MAPSLRIVAFTLTCLSAVAPASPTWVFEDPAGDDHGAGALLPPSGSEYRPGDFDLRRFRVRVEKKHAVLEVTLGAPLRRQIVRERGNASALDLTNGIFVQHLDIYVDTTPGEGLTKGLPGRRIAFAPEQAWDVAITLTPQPAFVRSILRDWDPKAAERVLTPGPLRPSGSTVTVRIPLEQLGGTPQATWGWAVTVSGAVWERNFEAIHRLRGVAQPDALTMPVVAVPEDRAFGGATVNGSHPWVIDVLVPPGRTQAQLLSVHTPEKPAVVQMLYPAGAPKLGATAVTPAATDGGTAEASNAPAVDTGTSAAPSDAPRPALASPAAATPDAGTDKAKPAGPLVLRIANVEGDLVVIPAPDGGVSPWQIGTVVDAKGMQIGRVVVTSVNRDFVLATLTEGKGVVAAGAQVRFGAPR